MSYTVDTLRAIKVASPEAELFLLLGADSLADLPNWREAHAICELAVPLVVRRGGHAAPNFDVLAPLMTPARLAEARRVQVDMAESPISSITMPAMIGMTLTVPNSVASGIDS